MTDTDRLHLPLIAGEQALKHVTHNEALAVLDGIVQLVTEALDAVTPPTSPVPGATYAIGAGATSAWAGRDSELAVWTEGGWRFAAPWEGWRLWDKSTSALHVHHDDSWTPLVDLIPALQNLPLLGVNAEADTTNRLSVRSPAVLFNALEVAEGGTGDVRLNLNREGALDTATIVFQSAWSGRAEIGLAGTEDLSIKVSAGGSSFATAMTVSSSDAFVAFGSLFGSTPSFPAVDSGVLTVETGHVVPVPESGSSDSVDTIAGGFDGALLLLSGTDGNTLSFTTGSGNLRLGATRVLDAAEDCLLLARRGSLWLEISFADNG